jgi:ATP-dependent helicase HepA
MTARINAELEAGRDRLLELHSFDRRRAVELLGRLKETAEATPLQDFIIAYWDAFGLEHEPGPGGSTVLRPGVHMLHDHFPGLSGDAVTLTFDRSVALAHEDRQFLTWEHPMLRGCIEMLTSGETGSAAVTVCSHPDYRTGSLLFEALFVNECIGPPGLEIQRYLPPTCLRLLLDAQGEECSERLPHRDLRGLCLSQNRKLVDTVLRSQGDRLKLLLQRAAGLAETRGAALAAEALAHMHADLQDEQQRLGALARVNPNVRASEIEQLALRRELLAKHLSAARIRLDAVRIVVMR